MGIEASCMGTISVVERHMLLLDYIVSNDSTILQAMEKIDRNSKGMVYVVSDEMLQGVVTDGDIRRYLLRHGNLEQSVMEVANKNPIALQVEDEEQADELMRVQGVRSIPILDEKHKIVKICFLDERVGIQKQELNIPVVIMAGGKGTRLYPYTQILPKPLIPIGDKTITEHIMDRFIEHGCSKFTMIVNYKKHFIKSYFEDNEKNLDIRFEEEPDFLGTGGGLRLLDKKIDSTFFMTNCDILIEEDYSKILKYHKENGNLVTMVCAVKKMVIPYGTVEMSQTEDVIGFKEKPEFSFVTNTGFYVLEPEFLQMIPKNTFIHITNVIQQCIESGKKVGVYKISEDKWLDMGQLEELEKMRRRLEV